ncbi:MAG: RNA polymerase sigma factor [Caldilineaceae bacterium]|nr:RNA polymerase sigma factor [Caldilineaceae bacterium]
MNDAPLGFHELYARYAADVRRFAFWLCGDGDEADDITAETFVRVWAGFDRVRMATVKGYLFTIARNLYLQARKQAQRQVELSDELTSTSPSPTEINEQRTELARVICVLQTLPEIDRVALILRVEEDLPYEEIAAILDISVAAAKVKVHRARLKLAAQRE